MTHTISRRSALGLMGAAAGVAVTGTGPLAGAAEGSARSLDLDDKDTLARTHRKLAFSLDEELTFWWLRGTRFGVVDALATPFWDMYVGTWLRTRDLEDGGYEVTSAGANFYTPPGGDTLLEVFRNPYTGKDIQMKYNAPKARRTAMGPEGGSSFTPDMPGMKVTSSHGAGPGWVEGDDVVVQGDMFFYADPMDPSSGEKSFRVNDWSTYVAKMSDVIDPAVTNAPCSQQFVDILHWPKWLEMDGQPGSYFSRNFGRKVFDYQQMPATWRKLFEGQFPEAAGDPSGILDMA
jgi:hypothetical protein